MSNPDNEQDSPGAPKSPAPCILTSSEVTQLKDALWKARCDIWQTARVSEYNLTGKDPNFPSDAPDAPPEFPTRIHRDGLTASYAACEEVCAASAMLADRMKTPALLWVVMNKGASGKKASHKDNIIVTCDHTLAVRTGRGFWFPVHHGCHHQARLDVRLHVRGCPCGDPVYDSHKPGMTDMLEAHIKTLFGGHAQHTAFNYVVQGDGDAGKDRAAIIGITSFADLMSFGGVKKHPHTLVLCDVILRPHLVIGSSHCVGMGAAAILRNGMADVDSWLGEGQVLINNMHAPKG